MGLGGFAGLGGKWGMTADVYGISNKVEMEPGGQWEGWRGAQYLALSLEP